jgi:hypothetical protein
MNAKEKIWTALFSLNFTDRYDTRKDKRTGSFIAVNVYVNAVKM